MVDDAKNCIHKRLSTCEIENPSLSAVSQSVFDFILSFSDCEPILPIISTSTESIQQSTYAPVKPISQLPVEKLVCPVEPAKKSESSFGLYTGISVLIFILAIGGVVFYAHKKRLF